MGAGINPRKEEYTTLGDFIKVSFVRDQPLIVARFPKMNAAFLTGFTGKLTEVRVLESGLVLTEQQKANKVSLDAEAAGLNKELNFLSSYFADAGLDTEVVSALKKDLSKGNIEGAVLKIESVKQYVVANQAALVAEGMAAGFAATMTGHKTSLEQKNTAQNSVLNSHKTLIDNNKDKYAELYGFIAKIAKNGKLVFDGTVTEDEYTISKIIKRMRSFNGGSGDNPAPGVG